MKKQKLSIEDVINHEFKNKKFRGLDPNEVDDFLELIIDDYEYFMQRIKELDKANEELRNENFRIKMTVLKQATHTLDVDEIKEARREMDELKEVQENKIVVDKIAMMEKELEELKKSI